MPARLDRAIESSVSRHRPGSRSICSSRTDRGRPERRATASRIPYSPGPKSVLHWKTPAPAPRMASASPKSSACSADRPGVMRPSAALCLVVREVEIPSAPARSAASARSRISAISSPVGAASWSAPRSPIT